MFKKVSNRLSDVGGNTFKLWAGITWASALTTAVASSINAVFSWWTSIIADAGLRLAGHIWLPTMGLWALSWITGKASWAIADIFHAKPA